MRLIFPNYETLRLALTSGVIPAEIALAPVRAGLTDEGKPFLEFEAPLTRGASAGLKRLGVVGSRAESPAGELYTCWPQALPITREARRPDLTNQTPVLFELSHTKQLPILVNEMLRLGNDRQSYLLLPAQPNQDQPVLLRVIGPPYYTLLRALERDLLTAGAPVLAYLEKSPRVWIEFGQTHPLIDSIKPPEGQFLLLKPPHQWLYLDDEPFRDVYEVLEFVIPGERYEHPSGQLQGKLEVPLRLTSGARAEPPELWVLRESAIERLDEFVRDLPSNDISRFSFAVAQDNSRTVIVLRLRPTARGHTTSPAQEFVLKGAQEFRAFKSLNNLFLPIHTALQPPLRRDVVRGLLADDPSMVVWLYPGDNGEFTPESLPDSAFRPLEDWVSYIIDHEREALSEWVAATTFDFDHFVCKEEVSSPPPPSGQPIKSRSRKLDSNPEPTEPNAGTLFGVATGTSRTVTDKPLPLPTEEESVISKSTNELQAQLRELESQFLKLEGPLDLADRQKLWPLLGRLNGLLNQTNDAAICWANALWYEESFRPEWIAGWLESEGLTRNHRNHLTILDRLLASTNPVPGEVRRLAVLMIAAAADPVPMPSLLSRLPEICTFLQKHEKSLGTRVTWLTWVAISQLSGNDALILARARDRILDRLLSEGQKPEHDLAAFLRLDGQRDLERTRVVLERVSRLAQLALAWGSSREQELEMNRPYVHLLFAFAMARLGDSSSAQQHIQQAKEYVATHHSDVAEFLLNAYEYRIDQALGNKSASGPLPAELLELLEKLNKLGEAGRLSRYVIDRMREQSRILEPQEKFDPYRYHKLEADDLFIELAKLPDEQDRSRLAERIRRLLRGQIKSRSLAESRLFTLVVGLPLSVRVNEQFTMELLKEVPAALEQIPGLPESKALEQQLALFERALFLAGHFDRTDLVRGLVAKFVKFLHEKPNKERFEAINKVSGVCIRNLRKLGLRDELHQLLDLLTNLVLQGQDLTAMRQRYANAWPETLRALLSLAAGWLATERTERAMPILDEARTLLYASEVGSPRERPQAKDYVPLACTYISVVGQSPVSEVMPRLEEVFRKLDKLPNTFTSSKFYSRMHLNIIEAIVLAIVQEEFVNGPHARRWLDEDEYLIRQRIHRELAQARSRQGH